MLPRTPNANAEKTKNSSNNNSLAKLWSVSGLQSVLKKNSWGHSPASVYLARKASKFVAQTSHLCLQSCWAAPSSRSAHFFAVNWSFPTYGDNRKPTVVRLGPGRTLPAIRRLIKLFVRAGVLHVWPIVQASESWSNIRGHMVRGVSLQH